MMNPVSKEIVSYLKSAPGWHFGGTLERTLDLRSKPSTISRELRSLAASQKIEVRRVQIDGKGQRVVQYRYPTDPVDKLDL